MTIKELQTDIEELRLKAFLQESSAHVELKENGLHASFRDVSLPAYEREYNNLRFNTATLEISSKGAVTPQSIDASMGSSSLTVSFRKWP